jgi:hypothetical protein
MTIETNSNATGRSSLGMLGTNPNTLRNVAVLQMNGTTPRAENDLKVGVKFNTGKEKAKDGSIGLLISGVVYDVVNTNECISLSNG